MDYKELILSALEAREKAYCPYSNFKVGSAILFENGEIYTGSNIENASLGATNCAVVGDTNSYTYPCGICRQVIAEFVRDEKIPVIIIKNENDYIVKTFEEILPGSFSKKDLLG